MAFKSGISLCGIQMDYSKDFINGDISFFKRTYNSFFLDPTFESINLSDCSFAITRDLISKQYAKALLPFVDPKAIDEIPQVEIRTVERGFVELNIMLNGQRMYCGEDKTGVNQTYPFVPLWEDL